MADESMEAELARFDEKFKSMERMLAEIVANQKEASEGRRRGYEAQERTEREVIGLTHRMTAVEKSVEAIKPTTAELERVRDRAIVAGKLGKLIWEVSKALIAAAAGAVTLYYTMTGKPPP
jgi:hypothetical protein